MHNKKMSPLFRIIVVILVISFSMPLSVYATVDEEIAPRASYYLDSYNAYIYPAALGKIQVYFHVVGVSTMDDIGLLTVQLYESTDNINWTWVKTARYTSYSGMLGHDAIYYSGHVDFQGTIGRYYKAYVCIWAGKDGDGDTRYMWTQPKKATLLPG